ncbi:MAG: hypothetical protein NMK33_02585 [Candidatus Cardinium sp.]|uniref:hypothetical protein n=1 Tax=Cardinium endosymbiont of Dermatophagoides farinae TaxID=2597823 RepID=UPI0011938851|nr:hypothetical protein [Cardinium endosymbiont of Dermatophagoides farinae]TSJ81362.1 hypothetical protein FPG78_05255 [Cardinium endosymbiont of Dermatophagoides farinae]UWW97427.1 MAG: hypothetical protein NMK33_02585 [Candidatus Cardinium sp.]
MGMYSTRESVGENTPCAQSTHLTYSSQVRTAVKEQADIYAACLTSHENHTVTFHFIDGKCMATVRENLSDDFINEMQLPVYVDSGITMEQLLDATPDFQKRHIHVTFPKRSEDKEGHVYIGNTGLKGGGPVSSRLYKFEGFTPLSDHINWPSLSNCSIGEAIAEVAKACESGASDLWMP